MENLKFSSRVKNSTWVIQTKLKLQLSIPSYSSTSNRMVAFAINNKFDKW